MKTVICVALIALTLSSCTKESNTEIDLSEQVYTDQAGNLLGGYPGGAGNTFNATEMALFNSLDTVSLTGIIKPSTASNSYPFPNPSNGSFEIAYTLSSNTDTVIAKYVITNKNLIAVYKAVALITGTGSIMALQPPIPAGKYRLYSTLNAAGHDHYQTTWVNIQIN